MKSLLVKEDPKDPMVQESIKVSINAGRYDWLIRKPGTFAAEPLVIDIQSNRSFVLSFSKFGDLQSKTLNPGKIPAFYSIGATLAETERNGWFPARKLNGVSLTAVVEADQTRQFVWKLWPKIEITKNTRAGDYEDTGCLTFTILENQIYLDGEPGGNARKTIMSRGESAVEDPM